LVTGTLLGPNLASGSNSEGFSGALAEKTQDEGFSDELQFVITLQGIFGLHRDNGGGITRF